MRENNSPQVTAPTTGQTTALFRAAETKACPTTTNDALLRDAAMSAKPAIRAGLAIIAIFFLCLLLWMIYVPLRSDIHATGEVVFKTKRQTVQHLEGGIVKEILVRDGDLAQAGQPLIRLESDQVEPLVNLYEEQNLSEIAYLARMTAESKDLDSIRYPRSLTDRAKEPAVARIIETEERLFTTRKAAFQNQQKLLQLQIAQITESTKGTQERLAAKKQEIALLREQLETNQALQKQGYVTNTVVQDIQRTLAAYTGEYDVLAASIASDRQRKAEFEQRIQAVKAERIQNAVNDMKQSSLRRIEQQEKARPLQDTLDRQVIRAPITGKIVGLKVSTIGGVILPREALLEIAPMGDDLVLEAKITLEDISEVKVGQQADVTISGIHLLTRPDVKAVVKYISDDRLVAPASQGQQPYYAAQLEFDRESLKTLGDVVLKPGMTALVAIGTKPRTPFSDMYDSAYQRFQKSLGTR